MPVIQNMALCGANKQMPIVSDNTDSIGKYVMPVNNYKSKDLNSKNLTDKTSDR